MVILSLQFFEELDHVSMPQLGPHFLLVLDLLLNCVNVAVNFLVQDLFVDTLDSHDFSRELVEGEVDFAKSAAAEQLTELIKPGTSVRSPIVSLESDLDLLLDPVDLLLPG